MSQSLNQDGPVAPLLQGLSILSPTMNAKIGKGPSWPRGLQSRIKINYYPEESSVALFFFAPGHALTFPDPHLTLRKDLYRGAIVESLPQ